MESYNKTRRDFRIASADDPCTSLFVSGFCAQPNLYQTEKVQGKGQATDGWWEFEGSKEAPAKGYLAFYLEVHFERKGRKEPNAFRVSTEMSIIPKGFPFEDCEGEECRGQLV